MPPQPINVGSVNFQLSVTQLSINDQLSMIIGSLIINWVTGSLKIDN